MKTTNTITWLRIIAMLSLTISALADGNGGTNDNGKPATGAADTIPQPTTKPRVNHPKVSAGKDGEDALDEKQAYGD